ncbi:MAG: class I SAM-dependent methyltransferase [Deltaproteobacteria bacterium]|nr:class I SAM-dependent methyltransferase [Deltaproteobacteria bacterium]
MKRVHVPELMDLRWFPSALRAPMTNLIVVLARKMGAVPVLAGLVERALAQSGAKRVVDLGSGSGGSMPEVVERLPGVELVMTDKFPDRGAVERFNDPSRPSVRYARESVDATDLASAPAGVKTMVNCFHHMRPAQARAILASAHRDRQPILIYELTDNAVPFPLWLLFLPLSLLLVFITALFFTFAVRPLTLRQLALTFVVPIVPLCYAWDGQASMPRIYSFGDLDELLAGLSSDDYVWEKGHATNAAGKKKGIYLLGLPTATKA